MNETVAQCLASYEQGLLTQLELVHALTALTAHREVDDVLVEVPPPFRESLIAHFYATFDNDEPPDAFLWRDEDSDAVIGAVRAWIARHRTALPQPSGDLRAKLDAHRAAIQSGGTTTVSFVGEHASALDLRNAVLADAVLDDADLSGSQLDNSDLSSSSARAAKLTGARLRDANLGKAEFYDANLEGADATGASFRKAVLDGADLSRATLRNADLFKASLVEARVIGADLAAANLRRARLRRADLTNADLTGANLDEAFLESSTILAGARGLGTIEAGRIFLDGVPIDGIEAVHAALLRLAATATRES